MFSGSTTSWDVPPGTDYTIESSVFNYNSNYYTGPGDPTATGAFGAFDIAPYESVDATIVNLPNSTIPLTDET